VGKSVKTLEFIMPNTAHAAFQRCIASMYDALSTRLTVPSIEDAECHYAGEGEKLRDLIRATLGSEECNRLVARAVKEWITEEGLVALAHASKQYYTSGDIDAGFAAPNHPTFVEGPKSALQIEVALDLEALGRLEEAGRLFCETMEACRRERGSEGGKWVSRAVLSGRNFARVLAKQGDAAKAEPLLREVHSYLTASLGPMHPDTLGTAVELGGALKTLGRVKEAVAVFRSVYKIRMTSLGAENSQTLDAAVDLSAALNALPPPPSLHLRGGSEAALAAQASQNEATHLLSMVLEVRKAQSGDGSLAVLDAAQNLAGAYRRQGLLVEASQRLALVSVAKRDKLGATHSSTLDSLVMYAEVLMELGKYEEAAARYREAIEGRRRALSDAHPFTLALKHSLAEVLLRLGRPEEAESLLREASSGRALALGDEKPSTLSSRALLADALCDLNRLDEAVVLYSSVLEARRRVLRAQHPSTLETMNNLASTLREKGDVAEAAALYEEAMTGRRAELGDTHPSTLISIHNYAAALTELGKLKEASVLYAEALAGQRNSLGARHVSTLTSIHNLGLLCRHQGRQGEASVHFKEAFEGRLEVLGGEHPDTLASQGNLAEVLRILSGKVNLAEAVPHFAAVYAAYRLRSPTGKETLQLGNGFACCLRDCGRLEEAGSVFREVLETRRKTCGGMHEDTLETINDYAMALKIGGKIDEAAPLGVYKEAMLNARRHLGREHPDALAALKAYAKLLYVSTETDFADWLKQIREEERGVGMGGSLGAASSDRAALKSTLTPRAVTAAAGGKVDEKMHESRFPGTPAHKPPPGLLIAAKGVSAATPSGAPYRSTTLPKVNPAVPLNDPAHHSLPSSPAPGNFGVAAASTSIYPSPQPLDPPTPTPNVPNFNLNGPAVSNRGLSSSNATPLITPNTLPISAVTPAKSGANSEQTFQQQQQSTVPPHILEQYARYQQQQLLQQTQALMWQQHQLNLQLQQQQASIYSPPPQPSVLPSQQVPYQAPPPPPSYLVPNGHVARLAARFNTRGGSSDRRSDAPSVIAQPRDEDDLWDLREVEGRRRERARERKIVEVEEDEGEDRVYVRKSGDLGHSTLQSTLNTHLPALQRIIHGDRLPLTSPFADIGREPHSPLASRVALSHKEEVDSKLVAAITSSLKAPGELVSDIMAGMSFH